MEKPKNFSNWLDIVQETWIKMLENIESSLGYFAGCSSVASSFIKSKEDLDKSCLAIYNINNTNIFMSQDSSSPIHKIELNDIMKMNLQVY